MELKVETKAYQPERLLTEYGIKTLTTLYNCLTTHLLGYFNGEPKYKIPCIFPVIGMSKLQVNSAEELTFRIKMLELILGIDKTFKIIKDKEVNSNDN